MIVDASVGMKWLFEELGSEAAERLLVEGGLSAPSIFRVELGHALTKRARQRVLDEQTARELWTDMARMPVAIVETLPLQARAFELSLRLWASLHDCFYLALAERDGDILVTADRKFVAAVAAHGVFAGQVRALA